MRKTLFLLAAVLFGVSHSRLGRRTERGLRQSVASTCTYSSIASALSALSFIGPNTLNVTGACSESLNLTGYQNLTIQAASLGAATISPVNPQRRGVQPDKFTARHLPSANLEPWYADRSRFGNDARTPARFRIASASASMSARKQSPLFPAAPFRIIPGRDYARIPIPL